SRFIFTFRCRYQSGAQSKSKRWRQYYCRKEMIPEDQLDIEFKEAVERINSYTEPFPADLLLRLYTYYKNAINNYKTTKAKKQIITAFKTNALFQVKNVTPDEAKRIYIDLVNNYFLYGK